MDEGIEGERSAADGFDDTGCHQEGSFLIAGVMEFIHSLFDDVLNLLEEETSVLKIINGKLRGADLLEDVLLFGAEVLNAIIEMLDRFLEREGDFDLGLDELDFFHPIFHDDGGDERQLVWIIVIDGADSDAGALGDISHLEVL